LRPSFERIAPGGESEAMDGEALKGRLLEERARLEREIADLEADLSESLEDSSEESPYDQHMAETAAVTLDREIDLSLDENLRASVAQIDRALDKLEKGSYGRCDKCGKPIPGGRLEVAPFATLCIDCKRLEERNR
jgi:DnaK suppressor protein